MDAAMVGFEPLSLLQAMAPEECAFVCGGKGAVVGPTLELLAEEDQCTFSGDGHQTIPTPGGHRTPGS